MPPHTNTKTAMFDVVQNYEHLKQIIGEAERAGHRAKGSAQLLAVSKTKPEELIRQVYDAGQRCFAENYLQEALQKIHNLADLDIQWHFIGHIQSNKTRDIAAHFDWVHTVDSLKVATRLNKQRPADRSPLNVCIQINISHEPLKSGVTLQEVDELAGAILALPNLNLRGLMAIPAPSKQEDEQRKPFRQLADKFQQLNDQGFDMDTLSMGMSGDLEAAIAEGSTMVRIGTALFGARL